MRAVNPKYIYGSVKIAGPAIDFTDFLCDQVREFDRDVEAFAIAHIKEHLIGKEEEKEDATGV